MVAYSNWNILCTDMRSDKFIGMARMVSIYGRKRDVIFKYVEINSSGQKSRELATYFYIEVSYLFIYLVIVGLNS